MRTLRTLIAEDEPLARAALRDLVMAAPDLALIGEASDGASAARMIDDARPDLVFLDIVMPELPGLALLRSIQHRPAVIFTTAYDAYAVAAFELEAVDYLLKPFGRERFLVALDRARRRFVASPAPGEPAPHERAAHALDHRGYLERIYVARGARTLPVRVADIALLAGEDDYARVHAAGEQYLVNITLNAFERRLDPARFCRVHRSAIINLDHIASIARCDRRLQVRLRDGSQITASRAGTQLLRDRIGVANGVASGAPRDRPDD